MARVVGIGHQDFEKVRVNHNFYIDKTAFIKEWWEACDDVTLITRPRRFGKTLNMSMVEQFFSVRYAGRGELFEGLSIWQEEKYRKLQGTWPVISLSFANIKDPDYITMRKKICQILAEQYSRHSYLLDANLLDDKERDFFMKVSADMDDVKATLSLHYLANFLSRYYGKKVIILLDEYDTPMQEAYVDGFWEELVSFIRSLLNAAFKTNPYLERAIMTGITRVSKESVFSDLNNLTVVTTTSEKYAQCFGFTEEEVFAALEEYGLSNKKADVKRWYDGFVFGKVRDIYNPWSIINYLDNKELTSYWANTSSNSLAGKLIREGSSDVKKDFEDLISGKSLQKIIDEQIVFNQLSEDENAIWSLLLASGYLKVDSYEYDDFTGEKIYQLSLTNREVTIMFRNLIRGWFTRKETGYHAFIKALLMDDLDAMNEYMNQVALTTFSYFDTGEKPSKEDPERFYHGFVLGLMMDLADRYAITSNRESGFGRYDVVLEPLKPGLDAMIIEFKVFKPKREKNLEETVQNALLQIEQKKYETELIARGIPKEQIRKYGFAFKGKTVLIGSMRF